MATLQATRLSCPKHRLISLCDLTLLNIIVFALKLIKFYLRALLLQADAKLDDVGLNGIQRLRQLILPLPGRNAYPRAAQNTSMALVEHRATLAVLRPAR